MIARPVDLPSRLAAALLGAAAGEAAAGGAAGVRQLLDLAEAIEAAGGAVDPTELAARGFGEQPAGAPASLLLRGVLAGLLTPLDRPRLRQAAHRMVTLTRAGEGTAITAVATAVLAADLTRFDLDTALVRLRQTLLEEAPAALHLRLAVLEGPLPAASGDPGSALQLAITALDRAAEVPGAVDVLSTLDGEIGPACALAGALSGARAGLEGGDPGWIEETPARARIEELARRLGERAVSLLPR